MNNKLSFAVSVNDFENPDFEFFSDLAKKSFKS